MSITRIDLSLRVGPLLPGHAPPELMHALRKVEIQQKDAAPSGFQLTFLAEPDFALVADDRLQPFNRVLVRVAVDGSATTLIDGFITHVQYLPSNGPQESMLVVTGEDISVKMDLFELSREFPSFADSMTVIEALAPYLALGIVPEVIPSLSSVVPFTFVPQQSGTDRCLIRQLAERNGCVFYLTPMDVPFLNVAYWGPPKRWEDPCAVLDVVVGAASAADNVQASYDALAPASYYGLVMQTYAKPYFPVPVLTGFSTRLPALATEAGLRLETELDVRHHLWREDHDPIRAEIKAQAKTDLSTDDVVTLSCDVTPMRLGRIVCAPAVIGVRGTGPLYDGLYYLKSATHSISLLADEQWNYTQALVMTREGVGTTTTTLEAP